MSGVGHTIAVAPETRVQDGSTQWLVGDPWCLPARWSWTNESKLRKGAESWASAAAGRWPRPATPDLEQVPRAVLMAVVKFLMTVRTPAPDDPPGDDEETGGPGDQQILFTTTKVPVAAGPEGEDVAINLTPDKVTTSSIAKVAKGQAFYRDPKLTDKLSTFSSAREVPYIGLPLGVDGKSRAIKVTTSTPYTDKTARPTIVYVDKAATAVGPRP